MVVAMLVTFVLGMISGVLVMVFCAVSDGGTEVDDEYAVRKAWYEKGYEDGLRDKKAYEDDLK